MISISSLLSLFVFVFVRFCLGLRCHYCYQADTLKDCRLNIEECDAGEVCFSETSIIHKQSQQWEGLGDFDSARYQTTTLPPPLPSSPTTSSKNRIKVPSSGEKYYYHYPRRHYKMGCEHYKQCKDRVWHGQGPYGYIVTNKTCCCHPLCAHPDGVGLGVFFHCPVAWEDKEEEDKDEQGESKDKDGDVAGKGTSCHFSITIYIFHFVMISVYHI